MVSKTTINRSKFWMSSFFSFFLSHLLSFFISLLLRAFAKQTFSSWWTVLWQPVTDHSFHSLFLSNLLLKVLFPDSHSNTKNQEKQQYIKPYDKFILRYVYKSHSNTIHKPAISNFELVIKTYINHNVIMICIYRTCVMIS